MHGDTSKGRGGYGDQRQWKHHKSNAEPNRKVNNNTYRAVNPPQAPIPLPTATRPTSRQILEKVGFQFDHDYNLGNGRYSKVLRGWYENARKSFAIKVIDLAQVSAEFRDKFMPREIECWKGLNHPNNCYLYQTFIKYNYQFFIMELAEHGDLLSYVQNNDAIPEGRARNWMVQLINAVGYLHSHKIAHRDIKLENVLLFDNDVVKITDYGFCKQSVDLSETYCGSKSYSAPEILSGMPYDMFKADVWSLGVVAFVIVANSMPFREDVEHNWMIVESQRVRNYHYPSRIVLSYSCKSSIDAMLNFEPASRPTIKECCNLMWFRSAFRRQQMRH